MKNGLRNDSCCRCCCANADPHATGTAPAHDLAIVLIVAIEFKVTLLPLLLLRQCASSCHWQGTCSCARTLVIIAGTYLHELQCLALRKPHIQQPQALHQCQQQPRPSASLKFVKEGHGQTGISTIEFSNSRLPCDCHAEGRTAQSINPSIVLRDAVPVEDGTKGPRT